MELSYDWIRGNVLERYQDTNIYDYCDEYGEPGYSTTAGATTPMVLLGNWWCRCDKLGIDDNGRAILHDIAQHHPRVFKQLEDQGVQLEWSDEWIADSNSSKCYRTTGDSYSWQSSILWCDGDFLTPDDGIDAWIEEVVDDDSRCLSSRVWRRVELEEAGFVQWEPTDPHTYESGWHPGQTDDPKTVTREIREAMGDDVEVLFYLDEASQFYVGFSAWTRGGDAPREAISSNHYSMDDQLQDAVSYIEHNAPNQYAAFLVQFPEWESRTMSGSWFDVEAMEVDVEWSSWCIDWIEANTAVYWEDGEPWAPASS